MPSTDAVPGTYNGNVSVYVLPESISVPLGERILCVGSRAEVAAYV